MKKKLILLLTLPLLVMLFSCYSGSGSSETTGITTPVVAEIPLSDVDFDVDLGGQPWAFDIEAATLVNDSYRSANWTGKYMQLVFMSLKPGEVIDLEIHEDHDQFIRIEQGEAVVWMGKSENDLTYRQEVEDDWAIMIPAGYWHKVENTGDVDLKLYTLYGPPEHPMGTSNKTYEEAIEAHGHHHH
ncbi:cupin domain-containing protein [Alkalitalea saponilacus]|uniref:Mannose-6-phosphate isomerase, cupin superfamily n=1 Tax=Alkalitalea saponilacus TaxID=889453 RepID=A0A1T5HNF6_9BACT|nr:cupin domain-containing protein [Alkalitalea saponilacus]SKC22070.1 Mannose-6-phosphate isomerase, cupin superfamily [Alkalitalea saponilacus]